MLRKKDNTPYKNPITGVHLKTLVHGVNTSMHKFKLDGGNLLPVHTHPHEQTGYLVSGKMNFIIDNKKILTEPGDSWCIPGGVEHGVEVLEDCLVIEVFSPVREEYL